MILVNFLRFQSIAVSILLSINLFPSDYLDVIFLCRQKFAEVTQSMKAIGFVDEEINQVVAILAAILHIGGIVSPVVLIHGN